MGSGYGCGIEFLTHCHLLRNHTELTKIVGIEFDLGSPNKNNYNFHTKFSKF